MLGNNCLSVNRNLGQICPKLFLPTKIIVIKGKCMRDKGFAKRLKRLRCEAGMSLRELANKTGLAYQSIQHYEHGRCMPGSMAIAKIARALSTSGIYLLQGITHEDRDDATQRGNRSKRAGFILSAAARNVGLVPYDGRRVIEILTRYMAGEIQDIELYKMLREFLVEVHPVECRNVSVS